VKERGEAGSDGPMVIKETRRRTSVKRILGEYRPRSRHARIASGTFSKHHKNWRGDERSKFVMIRR
jgi:hypothetical protein